ncbi:hypothetical protein O181_001346 [Austropuccinia psidii MF-1]|uniref:Uncharacterized protein n=1 Tax=Austropuccinia psidii MF-1 TaxID=1389203 RepID=A0A9Q3BAT8_9BASI|nr:hypothetical protein [Austropuccinia psidii MF-1]
MLSNKHTKNSACLLCNTSGHGARGVPAQDSGVRTPLFSLIMKAFPSTNGCCDPKQEDRNFWMISQVPSSINLSTHHPMATSLLNQSEVIIPTMKDGNGIEKNQPNSAQEDSPIPHMPHKKTPRQPTPEPSQHNEPPIPGPSQSCKSLVSPHEDALTCEPESEVAATQSKEEPFGPLAPPLPPLRTQQPPPPPEPSFCHSHNEALQEFSYLQPALMIP